MKAKFFLFILQIFTFSFLTSAQSFYRFKYKSPDSRDVAVYNVFFVSYNNGSGFVRISFVSPGSNKNILAEMEIQERYAINKDGMPDTSKLVYEGMNPKIITGSSTIKFTPVTFWFKMNTENGYEPWAVTAVSENSAPARNNLLSVEYIKTGGLSSDIIKYFFIPKDEFYTAFYRPAGKGGGMLTSEERKTRMFLVVVASTYDKTLAPDDSTKLAYCLRDARKVVETFTDIADILGIRKNMVIDTIYGDRYNKTSVENSLKNFITPSKNDIVIFYYSGHGFTNQKIKDKVFPFLDLRDPLKRPKPDARTQTLNIQDIYDSIVKKGANFNLVISDCCNDTIEAKKVMVANPPAPKGITKMNFDNVKALFINNKEPVNLLMTAASKDERAATTPYFSSLFTFYFVESLLLYLSPAKVSPNWFRVLADAQKQTLFKASDIPCPGNKKCKQTPKLLLPK